MKHLSLLAFLAIFSVFTAGRSAATEKSKQQQPNILWLFAEDTSPWMGCYGDPINEGQTPHIDEGSADALSHGLTGARNSAC